MFWEAERDKFLHLGVFSTITLWNLPFKIALNIWFFPQKSLDLLEAERILNCINIDKKTQLFL